MKQFLLFAMLAVCARGQVGVQALANTHMQGVCPANQGSTGPTAGVQYSQFAFADYCFEVVHAWGGAVADATRKKLVTFGGGHAGYYGNQVTALDLSLSTPAWARLTDPAVWNANLSNGTICANTTSQPYCNANPASMAQPNGSPVSTHTYAGLARLPTQDGFLSFGGGTVPNGAGSPYTWIFSYATNQWTDMDPTCAGTCTVGGRTVTGVDMTTLYQGSSGNVCAYDPNTDTVFCNNITTGVLAQYDPNTNAWAQLNGTMPQGGGVMPAVDPARKRMYFMGENASAALSVGYVDISGADPTFSFVPVTTTGCSLMNAVWPGFVYDTHLLKFVGYPGSGNTFVIYDPGANSCTTQTVGGDTISAGNDLGYTFGRFQLFNLPTGLVYALVNDVDDNAYKITLYLTPPTITTTSPLPGGTHGTAYSQQLAANGSPTITWSVISGALPPGLTLSSGGLLSGTPTAGGTYSFTVNATNTASPDAQRTFSLTIAPLCSITSVPFPNGIINAAYSQTVTTTECASPSFAKTAGSLPAGLSLSSSTGVISGTPSAVGTSSFTVGVSDANCPVIQAGTCSSALSVQIVPGGGFISAAFVSVGVIR